MAIYPIKMLKDEEGNAFVPLTSSEALKTPDGKTLDEKLQNKLETTNIKAGTDINITVDGNNVTINNASKGVLIDNLTTETPGVGSLDAHQGKVLKEMIPEVVNNVTSTDSDKALSAYQGYLLSGKVVPTGGKEGQVLKKSSDTNWSLEWGDAADPNAIVGDGSIKKIVELTYEEYKELEAAGEIDEETEYHIADAAQTIQNLQDILDGLQNQIDTLKGSIPKINNTVTSTSTTEALSAAQGKGLNDRLDKLENYKNGETVIGTWTDGKPLYRYITNTTKKDLGTILNSLHIKYLKSTNGSYVTSKWNNSWAIPTAYNPEPDYNLWVMGGNTPGEGVQINFGSYYTDTSAVRLVIEYTKTTD